MCSGLKADIKAVKTVADKQMLWDRYMLHLTAQWIDKMVWWSLCELSRTWMDAAMKLGSRMSWASVGSSLGCIIVDGIDQSKFRLPRLHPRGILPKAVTVLHRPALHVAAAWWLGHSCDFYICDEDVKKDSTTQTEMLALATQTPLTK